MTSRDSAQRKEIRELKKKVANAEALLAQAAHYMNEASAQVERVEARNDTWRNLMVASAFARGLGNELPIIDVVQATHPQLLISRP